MTDTDDRYYAYTEDEQKSILGEAFHTAFRKGLDSPKAHPIWQAIQELDPDEWDSVLEFITWGFGVSGMAICRKESAMAESEKARMVPS